MSWVTEAEVKEIGISRGSVSSRPGTWWPLLERSFIPFKLYPLWHFWIFRILFKWIDEFLVNCRTLLSCLCSTGTVLSGFRLWMPMIRMTGTHSYSYFPLQTPPSLALLSVLSAKVLLLWLWLLDTIPHSVHSRRWAGLNAGFAVPLLCDLLWLMWNWCLLWTKITLPLESKRALFPLVLKCLIRFPE